MYVKCARKYPNQSTQDQHAMHYMAYLITAFMAFTLTAGSSSSTAQEMNTPLTFYEGNLDPSQAPQAYIDETSSIYKYCTETPNLSVNYECHCYASAFLDARTEQGESATKNNILFTIRDLCRNVEGTTKQQYQSCMSETFDTSTIAPHVTKENYCACVADQWKRAYSAHKGSVNNSVFRNETIFAANMACRSNLAK